MIEGYIVLPTVRVDTAQERDICVRPEELDLIKTSIVVAEFADFRRYSPNAGAARKD